MLRVALASTPLLRLQQGAKLPLAHLLPVYRSQLSERHVGHRDPMLGHNAFLTMPSEALIAFTLCCQAAVRTMAP